MIGTDRVVGLITARAGSKRVPGKNTRTLGGRPLVAWTIEAALRSRYVDRVIVSTDDPAVIEVATALGAEAPFVRPPELSDDHASSVDVGVHALEACGLAGDPGWLVLLQPTSPFRNDDDIDAALDLARERAATSVISVCPPDKSPYSMFRPRDDGTLQPLLDITMEQLQTARSQDFPSVFEINGATYVVRIPWFLERRAYFADDTLAFVMPRERSVNIDTEDDFALAEVIAARLGLTTEARP